MTNSKQIKAQITQRLQAREADLAAFLKRLEDILKTSTVELVRSALAGSEQAIDKLRLLNDFEGVLRQAGLRNEVASLRRVYAQELVYILDDFESLGITRASIFSSVDKDIVEVLINNDLNKIQSSISRYGIDFKAQAARAIIAGEAIDPVTIVEDLLPATISKATIELNTGMQAFNRAVTVKKAVDVFGKNPRFIYIGPDDSKTRQFCMSVLSRNSGIYTLQEISSMSNGQVEPVITYGGGYNCRHHWRPVSDKLAEDIQNER